MRRENDEFLCKLESAGYLCSVIKSVKCHDLGGIFRRLRVPSFIEYFRKMT